MYAVFDMSAGSLHWLKAEEEVQAAAAADDDTTDLIPSTPAGGWRITRIVLTILKEFAIQPHSPLHLKRQKCPR